MKRRVADNDKEGIDKQIIFPTKIAIRRWSRRSRRRARPLLQQLGARLVRVTRSAVAGRHHGPLASLKRCRRASPPASESRVQGLHLVPYTKTRTIEEEAFFPFYAAAEELDVALMSSQFWRRFRISTRRKAARAFSEPLWDGRSTHMVWPDWCAGRVREIPQLRVAFFECRRVDSLLDAPHDDDFKSSEHASRT